MKKRSEKRENETMVCLMSGLTNEAWTAVRRSSTKKLDQPTALSKLFATLDQHKCGERTELPNLFDELFTQMW